MDLFSAPVIASIITFTGTVIVAKISIQNNRKTSKENKKLIERTDLIEKRKVLEKKLNEFYIPLRYYLAQSKTLFKIFMKDKPNDFRTLTFLLDQECEYGEEKMRVILNQNDKALLKTIIDIGSKIETLIHEKSYLIGSDREFVDNYQPSEGYKHIPYDKDLTLINLLISHLVTIRMAFNCEIKGQVDKFEGFVFPNEINSKINSKIEELENTLISYESKILNLIS
ncbi:hypothetical protein [Flavobacterium yafengii]|uniref:DUF4760 domain-containing protein n=1 Tax=Flavobacterium yafengii TaxID=3041253 RepID=A0AAW6TS29_9FLAO|nr:hypothetical protein [Flavobacterium yafengii]MDI5950278.1 hypothetical protein [Flavobacterium yafengii]